MGILKILNGTTFEQLNDSREKRKATGLAFLQGQGNRRRGVRFDSGEVGRRNSDNASVGRRASDSPEIVKNTEIKAK